MDGKEAILRATMDLIEEKGEDVESITTREICARAGVGVGLVNYHFGTRDALINTAVERVINGIVDRFQTIREKTRDLSPFEKLECLGNLTFNFLFDHYAVSKISILSDMRSPKADDNTHRTCAAYLPLVAACRPDWDAETLERRTFCLISTMQHAFLRHEVIREQTGIDLSCEEDRKCFHRSILTDLLETLP